MAFPKIEGYVVTEKLGSGSYSVVYKAYTKVGGRSVVAIKVVDKSRVRHSSAAIENLVTEIRLLKKLSHPHIVQLKNFTWDEKNIYIIMEYCCGGDLSKYIHRYGRVPEAQVLYFLQQLASALKFLREKDIVHMDLKPHNLLLHKDTDGRHLLKVADFGFAQYLADTCEGGSLRGSPLYMAPELLARKDYTPAVDLWSVGVIMYECLFGRAPYSSGSLQELLRKIQTHQPIEFPRSPAISPGCLTLLKGLLQHDPSKRISYEEFFAHRYLDLEHMPTKENYEKAVNLVRRAVSLESGGFAQEALNAYCESLRYLLPALAHRDPASRPALRAKVIRYMERAEHLKKFLEGLKEEAGDNSRASEISEALEQVHPELVPEELAQKYEDASDTLPQSDEDVFYNAESHWVAPIGASARHTGEQAVTSSPRGLRRWFKKQISIPEDPKRLEKNEKQGETTNDCRIM